MRALQRAFASRTMAPMATSNRVRQYLVSTIAALERHHPGDPRLPVLRGQLATEGLAEHIQRVTDSAPLTDDQRARLALLLNPGSGRATPHTTTPPPHRPRP